MTTTERLGLPFIDAGQAQKDVTHNEALLLLDGAVQPAVVSIGLGEPPAARAIGEQWIVGADADGEWQGHALAHASWTAAGWRFVPAFEGMAAWSIADGCAVRFAQGEWRTGRLDAREIVIDGKRVLGARVAAIADPTGDGSVDSAARMTLAAILRALRAHGLIES